MSPAERAALLEAPTLSLTETANVLAVGLSGLRDGLRRGDVDLQQVRIGTRVVITTSSLLQLLGIAEATSSVVARVEAADGVAA
jgi:hypothetical protein